MLVHLTSLLPALALLSSPALAACELPPSSEAAKVVVVAAYEGKTLSSVALGDQDVETTVATLTISAGKAPPYIIATSFEALVWQLQGATDRVEQFAILGSRSRKSVVGGVVGLPRERVAWIRECELSYQILQEAGNPLFPKVIGRLVGMPVNAIAGKYGILNLRLPEGSEVAEPGEFVTPLCVGQIGSTEACQSLQRFSPGGVAFIMPSEVVANVEVTEYETLPQQAGLVQLLKEGKMREATDRDRAQWRARTAPPEAERLAALAEGRLTSARPTRTIDYVILGQLRFPAGLNGAHSVTFLLADGAPEPTGRPGHSQVLRFDPSAERNP